MRRGMMAAGFLLAGALTMTTTADGDGQDKKDDKWPDRVTVRKWIADQKFFLPPDKDRPARFKEIGKTDKTPAWDLRNAGFPTPTVGSEIIDKDGVVWVVTKVLRDDASTLCLVKKAPDKKPD